MPTSGVPVDRADVTEAVDRELAGYGLRQKVSSRVRVRENGKVGA